MTITTNNGNERPKHDVRWWLHHITAGIALAGLILYVGCLITGVI